MDTVGEIPIYISQPPPPPELKPVQVTAAPPGEIKQGPPRVEQLNGLMIEMLNSNLLTDSTRNKGLMAKILAGLDQVPPEELQKYNLLYGQAKLVYRFGRIYDYPKSRENVVARSPVGPVDERKFFVDVALKLGNKEQLLDAVDELDGDLKNNGSGVQRKENPHIIHMLLEIGKKAVDPEVKAKAAQVLGEFIFTASTLDLPSAKSELKKLGDQLNEQKDELSAGRLLEVLSKEINQEGSPLSQDMELLSQTFRTVTEMVRGIPNLTKQSTDLLFRLISKQAASAGVSTPVISEMIGQIVPIIKSLPVEARRVFAFRFKAIPVEGMGGGPAQSENIRKLFSTAATDIEASVPFEKRKKDAIGDGFEGTPSA